MTPLLTVAAALSMPALSIAGVLSEAKVLSSRIVGGSMAKPGQFPALVAIEVGGFQNCGGTLLGPNLVLTAGHCVRGHLTNTLTTRVEGGITVGVSSYKIHPRYYQPKFDHDLAVVHLASSIARGESIDYGNLAAAGTDVAAGSTVTVAGWGWTRNSDTATTTALLYASIPVMDRATCATHYAGESLEITQTMICAGMKGRVSCKGDSGGPVYDASGRQIVGVIAWGKQCAENGHPAVFVRVGNYRDWIEQNSGRS
ncbi:hypothetical protein LOZ51_003836 [Ophidiomyces ophidiicola]|nr:hypothetical protein LOZ54_002049 [Ophidiomyces ophidiicola]KAI1993457.1 hypothetical protein LOZ51_003836 [Ophidiomyces ophidiicola]